MNGVMKLMTTWFQKCDQRKLNGSFSHESVSNISCVDPPNEADLEIRNCLFAAFRRVTLEVCQELGKVRKKRVVYCDGECISNCGGLIRQLNNTATNTKSKPMLKLS